MRQVNVHEAKAQLSKLLAWVERGERVVISRSGVPVAVLSAYRPVVRSRRLGLFVGQGRIRDDFDVLPARIASAFGRET